jgi:hypothetical protein
MGSDFSVSAFQHFSFSPPPISVVQLFHCPFQHVSFSAFGFAAFCFPSFSFSAFQRLTCRLTLCG